MALPISSSRAISGNAILKAHKIRRKEIVNFTPNTVILRLKWVRFTVNERQSGLLRVQNVTHAHSPQSGRAEVRLEPYPFVVTDHLQGRV
jgi:hypothetical protein